jgi:uncharacterized phosphosugar-binding protein
MKKFMESPKREKRKMTNQQSFRMELFLQQSLPIIDQVIKTQSDAIRRVAQLFADCIERDGVIQVYGTGHSRAFAMELAGRAGGLVPVNRLDLEDLALHAHWSLERVTNPDIERDPEAGKALLACYQVEPQDVFLICSNSGVNNAIVDVAQQVKEHDHTLIAVTSLEHSQRMQSRHASGKKLYELADIVIDNHGPFGDALLELPSGGKVCAISSVTGAIIAQMLTAETIGTLLDHGKDPPVYLSANVPGGIERNQETVQHYSGRIRPS